MEQEKKYSTAPCSSTARITSCDCAFGLLTSPNLRISVGEINGVNKTIVINLR
ncbi:hypothetical protein C7475_104190 [Chitinophaga sp. S165]|nr:hypothetical protein C7475_104190 [Chitinophaga sp. S165]